jgi:hypothetical protein
MNTCFEYCIQHLLIRGVRITDYAHTTGEPARNHTSRTCSGDRSGDVRNTIGYSDYLYVPRIIAPTPHLYPHCPDSALCVWWGEHR